MQAGRRIHFWLFALLACLAPAGCRHGNNDVLENELRARDIQYRELLDDLKNSEFQNESLQREIAALRHGSKISPELSAHTFGVRRLSLGRGTSTIDLDHLPGDDALQVLVEPRDGDDHVIKAPGNLEITAMEVSQQGTKSVLSTWTIDPEGMRQNWKQGLFATGYVLVLPWKSWPQSENLRVQARLILTDGRVFEADRDVKVRLPASTVPRPGPVMPEGAVEETSKARSAPATTPVQQARWQPASLAKAVHLGRPEPINPPPPVHLSDLIDEPADPYAIWGQRR